MSTKARVYIVLTSVLGLAVLLNGLVRWESRDPARFFCYFLVALVAAVLKVALPAVKGTMSVNFLFVLIGMVELSYPEVLALGCGSILMQCFWKPKTPPSISRVFFNASSMSIAIAVSSASYHFLFGAGLEGQRAFALALTACVFFVSNTFPVAAVIALTERKVLAVVWRDCYFWSFPYYLIGAAVAGLFTTLNRFVGWQASTLMLPVIYVIYRSYQLYLDRLETEKKHVEEMASLHLRTIEALALAIEAKDQTTHEHLQRVQVFALEVGKKLALNPPELEALRAASLLHDIGKLAVPEHIISKPGRLTPEEFDKMKIHPVVGAEILERVNFPYPVVPIVRAHHEKWNGLGYPAGLKEEEIPMGARILAAVDCLDALASDRQYRRALPLDEAMAHVVSEAGKSFDPRVVEILHQNYRELDALVRSQSIEKSKLSTDVTIERGAAPAAGFETIRTPAAPAGGRPIDFLSSIAAARQEVQVLFDLTRDLGNSLSLDETLSMLGVRLKRMVPYDAVAIYLRRENKLIPAYVNGENFRLFSSLEIPIGQGLSGWVAENNKAIVNGNPSVEPGYLNDPSKFSTMRSALAVPLEGTNGLVGVLTLYHGERDVFTKDHLRILLAVSYKVALSIENALRYRQAETSAATDPLTGLPNGRSLFLHLDGELARCRRQGLPLAVLVCDLDGFKQVNDRFGHLEGNKLLRDLAQGLQEHCREYDYVARMGGDEFVVVMPGHKREAADAKAQALADLVLRIARQKWGEDLLSMSVGQAFYPDDGDDTEQLLAEADRRMYKVKQQQKTPARSERRTWEELPRTTVVQ